MVHGTITPLPHDVFGNLKDGALTCSYVPDRQTSVPRDRLAAVRRKKDCREGTRALGVHHPELPGTRVVPHGARICVGAKHVRHRHDPTTVWRDRYARYAREAVVVCLPRCPFMPGL